MWGNKVDDPDIRNPFARQARYTNIHTCLANIHAARRCTCCLSVDGMKCSQRMFSCAGAPTLITIRTETFAHTEPRLLYTAARPSPHPYPRYDAADEVQHCLEPSGAHNPSIPMAPCEIDPVHPHRQFGLVSNCPEEDPWCRCQRGPLCPRTPILDEGHISGVPPQ